MDQQDKIIRWRKDKEKNLDEFLQKNGGIVGTMMDDNKFSFYNIIKYVEVLDFYVEEDEAPVRVEYELIKLNTQQVKISIRDITFCISAVGGLAVSGNGKVEVHHTYLFNGRRETPYLAKGEEIQDLLHMRMNTKLEEVFTIYFISLHDFFFREETTTKLNNRWLSHI